MRKYPLIFKCFINNFKQKREREARFPPIIYMLFIGCIIHKNTYALITSSVIFCVLLRSKCFENLTKGEEQSLARKVNRSHTSSVGVKIIQFT